MTKAETISELKKYEQQYWAYDKSYQRCETLRKQITEAQKPYREKERSTCSNGKLVLQFLYVAAIAIFIIALLLNIAESVFRTALVSPLVNAVFTLKWLIIPILAVGFFVFYKYRRAKIKEENDQIISENAKRHREWLQKQNMLPNYKQQLKEEQAKQQRLKQQAWNQGIRCGLRGNYMNPKVVEGLIAYLETGRSDTLKEALNLYEAEKREASRDEETRRHRAEMERYASEQTEAARATARNSEEAAFWSAATAFAAFCAAENISKAQSNQDYHVV